MDFPSPLVSATLIKRYKRFLADVRLSDGSLSVAHCANPGAMLGLAVPGNPIWLSPSPNPKAKLSWRWELEDVQGQLVGINTGHPNRIITEAIRAGMIPQLGPHSRLQQEVAYGTNSRIDVLLENENGQRTYIEVKNVHWKRHGRAEFPDSVTARGAKHLAELTQMVRDGHRAWLVYCVQRADCDSLAIAADIDPAYAAAFQAAQKAGVQSVAVGCKLTIEGIYADRIIPLEPVE